MIASEPNYSSRMSVFFGVYEPLCNSLRIVLECLDWQDPRHRRVLHCSLESFIDQSEDFARVVPPIGLEEMHAAAGEVVHAFAEMAVTGRELCNYVDAWTTRRQQLDLDKQRQLLQSFTDKFGEAVEAANRFPGRWADA